jgi:hypothetical protein
MFRERPSCLLASAGKGIEFHVFMANCMETTRHGTMNNAESKMGSVDALTINPSAGEEQRSRAQFGQVDGASRRRTPILGSPGRGSVAGCRGRRGGRRR